MLVILDYAISNSEGLKKFDNWHILFTCTLQQQKSCEKPQFPMI